MRRVALTLATWFGTGKFPVAPGTAGSAVAVGIAALLRGRTSPWEYAVFAAALLPVGIWAADVTSKAVKDTDPCMVVVDEVVGQWITLAGARSLDAKSLILAFALFRLFDIWKPKPIRQLEALPGGLGIMADDTLAGVYGALVLWAAGWFNLY